MKITFIGGEARKMRWAESVERREEERCIKILEEKSVRKGPLGILDVDGSIMLKFIFKRVIWTWIGLLCLMIGTIGGLLCLL
jgi:hypothetical protein